MLDLAFLFLVIILSYLTGISCLKLFKLSFDNCAERLLLSIVFGLGLIILAMFLLGVLGLYYKTFLLVIFLLGLIVLGFKTGKKEFNIFHKRLKLDIFKQNSLFKLILVIFLIYIFYNTIRCMTPVINPDSVAAYLVTPKLYVEHHKIFNPDWVLWAHVPHNVHMLSVLGMLLSSDILSQLISGWLMGLLSALAIYVLARNFVNRKIALLAAIIFYTIPTVSWLIYSTKVDLGYTLFELTFWVLFVKWFKDKQRKNLYIAGIFLGLAIGSKYHSLITLFFAVIAILIILILKKKPIKYILFTVIIFGLIALVIGSPSYIKNYIYTQDPVYPFITDPDFGSFEGVNQYKGMFDYFKFQYNMIFEKGFLIEKFNIKGRPFGFLSILFIPFIVLDYNFKKDKKKIIIILVSYYIFVSLIIYKSVYPFPRHFLPAIGLLSVINSMGIKGSLKYINKKAIYFIVLITIVTMLFLNNVGFTKTKLVDLKHKLKYITGKISKTNYLRKTLYDKSFHMSYQMIKYVEKMPADTRIMTLDYGNSYYIPRPFIKKQYIHDIRNRNQLIKQLKKDKITHIYFNKPLMKRYIQNYYNGYNSVILDEKKSNFLSLEFYYKNQYLYKINF